MDIFVLFVLFSIPSQRKIVEKLFVRKVRADCFNEELMNTAFGTHPEVRGQSTAASPVPANGG